MDIDFECFLKVKGKIHILEECEEVVNIANQVNKESINRLALNMLATPINEKIKSINKDFVVSFVETKAKVDE